MRDACKHYRAMSNNDTCKADVPYSKFEGIPFKQRPCFQNDCNPLPVVCELAEYPSAEETAAMDREIELRFANTMKAREAIVDHIGGPWKRDQPGISGSLPCPVCGKGTLRFSRAGYNGHIHARCSDADCVSWME